MRAFVQLRGMLAAHAELARKLDELERKYDAQFRVVFDAVRELMQPPPPPERKSASGMADRRWIASGLIRGPAQPGERRQAELPVGVEAGARVAHSVP